MRRLWQVIRKEYGIENELYILAETSLTNNSVSDSYNNLLRTTVEAMAAVTGGCNELVVQPFDALLPVNRSLSQRLAVNQQLILKEESYLDKMADISCGSYYIESLTDALAAESLEIFKSFEQAGGYFKCLEKEIFSCEIAKQSAIDDAAIEDGSQVAVGVNKFRNEKEGPVLSEAQIENLKSLPIHNAILKYELANYKLKNA
jgi:methylmalonyl-CoA mutase